MTEFKFEKGYTHGGVFHADDVFATAFLTMLNPNFEVERGFKPPVDDESIIVYDIGNGKFDHHSEPRECRAKNGKYYAAFGKLWREYANLIVSDFIKDRVDNDFVQIIDECDNTGESNLLSTCIYAFNPTWQDERSSSDEKFAKAVEIAKAILENIIDKYKSAEYARKEVLEYYAKSKDGLVIMDRYAPWEDALDEEINANRVKAIVFPSLRGGWNIERIEDSGFEFPKDWWGTREEKVKGLLFCHASGFMCNFKELQDILDIVELCKKK